MVVKEGYVVPSGTTPSFLAFVVHYVFWRIANGVLGSPASPVDVGHFLVVVPVVPAGLNSDLGWFPVEGTDTAASN